MTRRILAVDDDPRLLQAVSLRLQRAGYEVVSACDHEAALSIARRSPPDLLLLDVHLAQGTGFTVHERLWRIGRLRRTPVIYLTGDAASDLHGLAHQLGAHAIMRKPVAYETLVAAINSVLL